MGKHPTHSIHATLNGLPVSSKRREMVNTFQEQISTQIKATTVHKLYFLKSYE